MGEAKHIPGLSIDIGETGPLYYLFPMTGALSSPANIPSRRAIYQVVQEVVSFCVLLLFWSAMDRLVSRFLPEATVDFWAMVVLSIVLPALLFGIPVLWYTVILFIAGICGWRMTLLFRMHACRAILCDFTRCLYLAGSFTLLFATHLLVKESGTEFWWRFAGAYGASLGAIFGVLCLAHQWVFHQHRFQQPVSEEHAPRESLTAITELCVERIIKKH